MTALAHVVAARQHLRTLRRDAATPFTADSSGQGTTLTAATGDRAARDVPAAAASLLQLLTSDAVLEHIDQSLTERIWADALRNEDGVAFPVGDVSALAAAILPRAVEQPTPAQWKLLRHVSTGRVFRPVKGVMVRLPKPVQKGKPDLTGGEPVNSKTFQALINRGLVDVGWWWKGIEKASATDAGTAMLREHERAKRNLAAA